MDLKIEGKVALITGAGRGLGKSIACCLAKEGVSIVAASRTEEDLHRLREELALLGAGGAHRIFCYDLTLPEGPQELLSYLEHHKISPDIVVHNLGGNLNITDPFCSLEEIGRAHV